MNIQPPVRTRHTYRQHLAAPPERVFPLLCPVREVDWVQGWEPGVVFTDSGVAEPDCVFTTPDGDAEAVWVVTEYDPDGYRIGFVKVTPAELAVRIEIVLEGDDAGGTTAQVSYTYTALGPRGADRVARMTPAAYEAFMQEWEDELNHYLHTGRMREAS